MQIVSIVSLSFRQFPNLLLQFPYRFCDTETNNKMNKKEGGRPSHTGFPEALQTHNRNRTQPAPSSIASLHVIPCRSATVYITFLIYLFQRRDLSHVTSDWSSPTTVIVRKERYTVYFNHTSCL